MSLDPAALTRDISSATTRNSHQPNNAPPLLPHHPLIPYARLLICPHLFLRLVWTLSEDVVSSSSDARLFSPVTVRWKYGFRLIRRISGMTRDLWEYPERANSTLVLDLSSRFFQLAVYWTSLHSTLSIRFSSRAIGRKIRMFLLFAFWALVFFVPCLVMPVCHAHSVELTTARLRISSSFMNVYPQNIECFQALSFVSQGPQRLDWIQQPPHIFWCGFIYDLRYAIWAVRMKTSVSSFRSNSHHSGQWETTTNESRFSTFQLDASSAFFAFPNTQNFRNLFAWLYPNRDCLFVVSIEIEASARNWERERVR